MAGIDREPDKPVRTEADRRKRVNRLKKLIILTMILAILLPVLLCVILFLKLNRLEHKVQELEAAREVRLAGQMSGDERFSAGSGEVGHLEQADGNGNTAGGTGEDTGPDAGQDTPGDDLFDSGAAPAGIGSAADGGGTDPAVNGNAADGAEAAGKTGAEDAADGAEATGSAGAEDAADGAEDAGNTGAEDAVSGGGETQGSDAAEPSGEQLYPDYRKVYLTFDDGPSSNTEAILEILDRYGIKATFFVVGKTDEHSQQMYRRIVEEGHTLGMHSYSHRYGEIYASTEAFTEDLEKIRDYLYDMTGVTSYFYRFPGGSSNALSSTDVQELIDVLDDRGIIYFDWNIVNGDAGSVKLSAAQLADNVTNNMERYRTAIVLMHDAAGKPATVEALPTIIERILQMDQTVILPITEDTARIQQVKADEERQ